MSNWRVQLNGADITTKVSSVQTSYAAENICGEVTVELADRAVLGGIVVPRVPREFRQKAVFGVLLFLLAVAEFANGWDHSTPRQNLAA